MEHKNLGIYAHEYSQLSASDSSTAAIIQQLE